MNKNVLTRMSKQWQTFDNHRLYKIPDIQVLCLISQFFHPTTSLFILRFCEIWSVYLPQIVVCFCGEKFPLRQNNLLRLHWQWFFIEKLNNWWVWCFVTSLWIFRNLRSFRLTEISIYEFLRTFNNEYIT